VDFYLQLLMYFSVCAYRGGNCLSFRTVMTEQLNGSTQHVKSAFQSLIYSWNSYS